MAFLDEDTPGWVRGLLAAITLLVVAVVALIVVLVMNRGDDTESDRKTPTSTGSGSPAPSACDMPVGAQTLPTVAPKVSWSTLSNGARGPRSDDFGPGAERERVHSCFAQNPTGAAFSATWYILDTGQSVDKAMGEQLWSRLTESAAEEVRKESGVWSGDESDPQEERPMSVLGFRFVDVQPERVIVEVLIEDAVSMKLVGFTLAQVWKDGDWRTDSPPGSMDDFVRVVEDSAAFLLWEGAL